MISDNLSWGSSRIPALAAEEEEEESLVGIDITPAKMREAEVWKWGKFRKKERKDGRSGLQTGLG